MDKDNSPGINDAGNDDDDFELPDPRSVNRKERIKRAEEKRKERAAVRGTGKFKTLLTSVCQRKPNDVFGQLSVFFKEAGPIPARIGRARGTAAATNTTRGDTLFKVLEELRHEKSRMGIRNLTELGQAHVVALVRFWVNEGQSAAYIETKTSMLRGWFDLVGRPSTVPIHSEWKRILKEKGVDITKLRRTKVAKVDLSWQARGICPEEVIEAVTADDEVVGTMLALEYVFGARVKESWRVCPYMADGGDRGLHLTDGTKGGRSRWVPVHPNPAIAAIQQDVLRKALAVAANHPRRMLYTPDLKLNQMRNRYYTVMRRHGITRKELGVTSHGLRHGFVHGMFEAMAGLPAPVLRAAPVQLYHQRRDVILQALSEISEATGHSRRDIVGAYGSTVEWITRQAESQLLAISHRIQESKIVHAKLLAAGAITTWIIGELGAGLPLRDGPIQLQVLRKEGVEPPWAETLAADLSRLIGQPVMVAISTDRNARPEYGFELVFAAEREPAKRIKAHFRVPASPAKA